MNSYASEARKLYELYKNVGLDDEVYRRLSVGQGSGGGEASASSTGGPHEDDEDVDPLADDVEDDVEEGKEKGGAGAREKGARLPAIERERLGV